MIFTIDQYDEHSSYACPHNLVDITVDDDEVNEAMADIIFRESFNDLNIPRDIEPNVKKGIKRFVESMFVNPNMYEFYRDELQEYFQEIYG